MRENFAEMLFRLRRARKLLQKSVAHEVGIGPSHLAKLEGGRYENPTRDLVDRLAECLCRSPGERDALVFSAAISRLERAVQRANDGFPELTPVTEAVTSLATLDGDLVGHAREYLGLLQEGKNLRERRN